MSNFTKHIEDKILNIYILNPDILDSTDLININIHLIECQRCNKYYEEMKEFHNFIKELPDYRNSISVENEIKPQRESNIFLLKSSNLLELELNNNIKLAAMHKKDKTSSYTYVDTYTSAKKYLMMRVLRDNKTGEYVLFLICDDMDKVKNALLSFEGVEKYYISDKEGKIILPSDNFIENLDFTVYLPIARFNLTDKQGAIDYISDEYDVKLFYVVDENSLKAKFSFLKGKPYESTKIAVINSREIKNSKILDSDNFKFSLEKKSVDDLNEVILYESN
ncbi:MAG: hypothetical protein WC358_08365 [Ignavibacteria bacterium]|jgi:hypothetical protein